MSDKRQLRVKLLPDWVDLSSEYLDGPPTVIRESSVSPGALQFSISQYESGEMPDPSDDDLINLSIDVGEQSEAGQFLSSLSGKCQFGRFGSAIFQSEEIPHFSNMAS